MHCLALSVFAGVADLKILKYKCKLFASSWNWSRNSLYNSRTEPISLELRLQYPFMFQFWIPTIDLNENTHDSNIHSPEYRTCIVVSLKIKKLVPNQLNMIGVVYFNLWRLIKTFPSISGTIYDHVYSNSLNKTLLWWHKMFKAA